MGKININYEKMKREQEERLEQQRNERELSNIHESQIFEPAKSIVEQVIIGEDGRDLIQWHREPTILPRGHPNFGSEEPDLICEVNIGGQRCLYIIELKKVMGKKSIGQAILYQWAAREADCFISNGEEIEIPDKIPLFIGIGAIRPKHEYYKDCYNTIGKQLELGQTSFFRFPIDPDF